MPEPIDKAPSLVTGYARSCLFDLRHAGQPRAETALASEGGWAVLLMAFPTPGRPEASRPGIGAGPSGASLLLEQRRDLVPQLLPLRPLRLGQLRQRGGLPHAGQVGVLLPVPECLLHHRSCLGRALLGFLAPEGQVGLEPAECLPAQAAL